MKMEAGSAGKADGAGEDPPISPEPSGKAGGAIAPETSGEATPTTAMQKSQSSLGSQRAKLMAAGACAAAAITLGIVGAVIGVSVSRAGFTARGCSRAGFFDAACVEYPTDYTYPATYSTRTLVYVRRLKSVL